MGPSPQRGRAAKGAPPIAITTATATATATPSRHAWRSGAPPPRLSTVVAAAVVAVAAAAAAAAAPAADAAGLRGIHGERRAWHTLAADWNGPAVSETDGHNPFLHYRLDCTWRHAASGSTRRVPGFFAADGNAAATSASAGSVWRCHFAPPLAGRWEVRAAFWAGHNVAITVGEPVVGRYGARRAAFDGATGGVDVAPTDKAYPDFRRRGKLVYSASRYLRAAGSGEVFLRVGTNSPENLLGYNEFDNTPTALHRFAAHRQDWQPWMGTWGTSRNPRGKSLLGAINYLATMQMNSVYVLLLTVAGDSRDVWPFTSSGERYRMDVSKLAQWEVVFEYMNSRGIALHALFSETENESLFEHDETGKTGGFANSRRLYHREMVSRFGHHPGLLFNIGEETGWDDQGGWGPRRGLSDWQRKAFAADLAGLDSYDTPMVAHTYPNDHDKVYQPMLGNRHFDGVSLQLTSAESSHATAASWLAQSRARGRVWSVSVDEVGSGGVLPDAADWSRDRVRKELLWGTLMAGGSGVEVFSARKDQTLEDFRSYDRMWRQMAHAVAFFHRQRVPFWRMDSRDDLSSRPTSSWVLAAPAGDALVVYLQSAATGQSVDLRWVPGGARGTAFAVRWYNPRTGGRLWTGTVNEVRGGGWRFLGAPPSERRTDWVALVARWGSGIGGL